MHPAICAGCECFTPICLLFAVVVCARGRNLIYPTIQPSIHPSIYIKNENECCIVTIHRYVWYIICIIIIASLHTYLVWNHSNFTIIVVSCLIIFHWGSESTTFHICHGFLRYSHVFSCIGLHTTNDEWHFQTLYT